jgi:hypothetical protein
LPPNSPLKHVPAKSSARSRFDTHIHSLHSFIRPHIQAHPRHVNRTDLLPARRAQARAVLNSSYHTYTTRSIVHVLAQRSLLSRQTSCRPLPIRDTAPAVLGSKIPFGIALCSFSVPLTSPPSRSGYTRTPPSPLGSPLDRSSQVTLTPLIALLPTRTYTSLFRRSHLVVRSPLLYPHHPPPPRFATSKDRSEPHREGSIATRVRRKVTSL